MALIKQNDLLNIPANADVEFEIPTSTGKFYSFHFDFTGLDAVDGVLFIEKGNVKGGNYVPFEKAPTGVPIDDTEFTGVFDTRETSEFTKFRWVSGTNTIGIINIIISQKDA